MRKIIHDPGLIHVVPPLTLGGLSSGGVGQFVLDLFSLFPSLSCLGLSWFGSFAFLVKEFLVGIDPGLF